MLRRVLAVAALGVALALPAASVDAQGFRQWNRKSGSTPGIMMPPPLPPRVGIPGRSAPRLPDYFFDNRGAAVAGRQPLGQRDLLNSLRARGFNNIGAMQLRGSTYITEAVGPSGERVRLVIDGRTGQISGVRVISRGQR